MRTIAFYLPQFHEIPENNEWWGKGFTEWVNVKKAKPLFEGHRQPRGPMNDDYYDLSNHEVMKRQISLARQYGLYGFCFYHYWFDGHLLLQKPLEDLLADKETHFPYCICWANEHWTNVWVDGSAKVLIEQRYGEKAEWKDHFEYLLKFFRDEDYIKNNGKPFLVIYRPEIIPCLNEMIEYWRACAVEAGFPGLDIAFQHVSFRLSNNYDDSHFDHYIEYEPITAETLMKQEHHPHLRQLKRNVARVVEEHFGKDIRSIGSGGLKQYSYDDVWKYILNMNPESKKAIPGAFVDWDNTPRKGSRGTAYVGATPQKFQQYMTRQIKRAHDVYHTDMLFIFAWNEWAEGGVLEPEAHYGYGYLEGLRNALAANNELLER